MILLRKQLLAPMRCESRAPALAAVWILSMLMGCRIGSGFSARCQELIPLACAAEPGWIGALTVTAAPLILSAAAVALMGNRIIWVLCCARAILLGSILKLSAGSGLTATALLLFSSVASSAVLLLYWMQCLGKKKTSAMPALGIFLAAQLLIGAADVWAVSPLLWSLANHI